MKDENVIQSAASYDESEATAELNNEANTCSDSQGIDSKLFRGLDKVCEVVNSINSVYSRLAPTAQKYYAEYKPVFDKICQLTDSFARAIEEWDNLALKEKRREKLIESYKKWGECGWTLPPNAPIKSFYTIPKSIDEANNLMMKFCTKKDLEQLFKELRGQKLKQEDLEEAIDCYNNRHYKACALILFGLIDAKLIRKQVRNKERRPTGHKAAENLRERFKDENDRTILFIMLRGLNLFNYLELLFKKTDDFKTEPPTINRNFVSHGMARRSVRRRDCIQLFLALFNLAATLQYIT